MRTFHQLIFEGYITGTEDVFSDTQYNELLGAPDQLSLGGYTAQISGTSPTLTVQVEHSFDQVRWQSRNTAAAEINAVTLAGGTAESNVQGDDGSPYDRPTLAYGRLRIRLGGSSPAGQVRIWVTGRDRSGG